jgi:LCP family protein required for cell wall assembly
MAKIKRSPQEEEQSQPLHSNTAPGAAETPPRAEPAEPAEPGETAPTADFSLPLAGLNEADGEPDADAEAADDAAHADTLADPAVAQAITVDSDAFFVAPGTPPLSGNTAHAADAQSAQPSIYDIAAGRAQLHSETSTRIFAENAAANAAHSDTQEARTMIFSPSADKAKPACSPAAEPRAVPKRGWLLLAAQGVLSALAVFQLYRTQMLPVLYLALLGGVLALLLLLVWLGQRHRIRGVISRVFSLVLCAALAVGCVFAQQGLQALQNVTAGLLAGPEARAIVTEPFVVYLSGVDTRGELTENARSDVNILAVVNPTTKQIALINTPRDYYVPLAGTDSKDKLTHAGLYGVETSMQTLADLYGVEVDYYLRINFAGFMSIVDAVGGVDVYSDYTFTSVGSPGYYDPTDFVEGWNHLDGQAALAFARERHAFASGDVQRGINQMKVIQAMVDKLKSPTLLLSYSKLMNAVSDCFVTNLSSEQISALVKMQLSSGADWQIESFTATGASAYSTKCYSAKGQKLYVMTPDDASVAEGKALIDAVWNGTLAADTEEESAASSAA